MAVEARHINLFPSQLITNGNFMKANQVNANTYCSQMDSGLGFNGIIPETLLPLYQSAVCDPVSAKASMNKDDSGLTYNVPAPRKRARDQVNEFDTYGCTQKSKISGLTSLMDGEIVSQIQQQQSEIDGFIAEHAHKVRMELMERRKRQSIMLVSAVQEGVIKKLKEKDDELQRIGKLNWVLQERVNSLYVENQIWRDLAQTNEATANSLRSNLEQVLAHVSDDRHVSGGVAALADDAASSCGSCDDGRCTLADEVEVKDKGIMRVQDNNGSNRNWMCKKCGERESSVLLLPCRHLCLCTFCGSTLLRNCPVCDSVMNASVHVNMS